MREISPFEAKYISAGNRNTAQAMITITGLFSSGALYLWMANEIELSPYAKIGIGVFAVGLSCSLCLLKFISQKD